jgi:uncharacterized Zn-binding protein involved in type VI secretion
LPGFIVHQGAVVLCVHAGTAEPATASPQVTVMGMPVVTLSDPYTVAGCTFPAMTTGSPPCVTAQWTSGAVRVTSMGSPVVLQTSTSACAPNGTPLMPSTTQTRVSGT